MIFLHRILPILALINIVTLLTLFRRGAKELFSPFGKKHLLFCAALLAAQLPVYIFFAGKKHLIYIDEFWYMEAAKNMLVHGWAPGYEKSIGWPFMVSLSYLFGGVDNFTAIWTCILTGVLAPPACFATAFLLTGSFAVAAVSSAMLAFLPYSITWSASAETGAPALFFMCLAAFFSLSYYRERGRRLLWLALAAWAMAAQIRPECAMFFALFAAGIYLFMPERPRLDFNFALPWLASAVVILPNFIVFSRFQSSANWIAVESAGKASGSNISLYNLWYNTLHWGGRFFDGSLHPLPFTLACAAGAALLFARRKNAALWLAFWIAEMYLFYFSTWFNTYGSTTELFPKTKLFLLFYPAFCTVAAYALTSPWRETGWRKYAGVSVCAALWILCAMPPYYRNAKIHDDALELETRLLSDLKNNIPDSAIIISNAPVTVRSTSFLRTVDTEDFLKIPGLQADVLGSGKAYYLKDITADFVQQGLDKLNNAMYRNFNLQEEIVFSQGKTKYKLFRVAPKKPSPAAGS
jgi:4-amino-4-deoxy-L-arabinose transferase-like glycosyltransferase